MYSLWQTKSAIYVEIPNAPALKIGRNENIVTIATPNELLDAQGSPAVSVAAVLGVLPLVISRYLVVAKTKTIAGDVNGNSVYQLHDFELLHLRTSNVTDLVEEQYLDLARTHLKQASLFYSETYDLTNSVQRQAAGAPPDERFIWNSFLLKDMRQAALEHPELAGYIRPVMYGVFSIVSTSFHGSPVEFGIITRRSRHRAGTRYFRRGIDDAGNVANFNETEQLLVVKGEVFSFVQTRGSVPAFWAEINRMTYRPVLRVGDEHRSVSAAEKHFDEQVSIYGNNYLVNLVNQSGYEQAVKNIYEKVVNFLQNKRLQYIYFDFHHECSKMRWDRTAILIDVLVKHGFEKQQWCHVNMASGKQLNSQTSVVRSNCMDCLDRTNVVQSCLGAWVLQKQLEEANILKNGETWEADQKFVAVFRNVWADNADGVSCAYSGTGALKTDFTRTGQRTHQGALQDGINSVKRFYFNNLCDGPRQDAFDLILGNFSPLQRYDSPFVDRRSGWVQTVPYIFFGSSFVFLVSFLFPSARYSLLVSRLFSAFFLVIAVGCYYSIMSNGVQYVNWPKLVPLDFLKSKEAESPVSEDHSKRE